MIISIADLSCLRLGDRLRVKRYSDRLDVLVCGGLYCCGEVVGFWGRIVWVDCGDFCVEDCMGGGVGRGLFRMVLCRLFYLLLLLLAINN